MAPCWHKSSSVNPLTINGLGPAIMEQLRVRAGEHGHSMETEARRILQTALEGTPRSNRRDLYERIHARFAALGGVELELPPREPTRDPPRFE
jgi:plasmid stability protein